MVIPILFNIFKENHTKMSHMDNLIQLNTSARLFCTSVCLEGCFPSSPLSKYGRTLSSYTDNSPFCPSLLQGLVWPTHLSLHTSSEHRTLATSPSHCSGEREAQRSHPGRITHPKFLSSRRSSTVQENAGHGTQRSNLQCLSATRQDINTRFSMLQNHSYFL